MYALHSICHTENGLPNSPTNAFRNNKRKPNKIINLDIIYFIAIMHLIIFKSECANI